MEGDGEAVFKIEVLIDVELCVGVSAAPRYEIQDVGVV
jgi:hypothetical protein